MAKKDTSQVKEKNVEVVEEEESTLYYFYSVGCGFCKKIDPIIDELNKEGHNILKLDLADKDNQGLKKELSIKYKKQCGTPWLIDASNGNQVCGFRDKETIMKWVNGEDIPAPPKPNGVPPRPPFMDASDEEVTKWKEDYNKWLDSNEHLPEERRKPADEILEMPRPKTAPPKPPEPLATDEQLDKWAELYTKWKGENEHLPNLHPVETILQNFKNRRNQMQQQQNTANLKAQSNDELINRIDKLEQKIDKIMNHFGVKG
jgi:thiol-disulfide isomerase/thioredoxin